MGEASTAATTLGRALTILESGTAPLDTAMSMLTRHAEANPWVGVASSPQRCQWWCLNSSEDHHTAPPDQVTVHRGQEAGAVELSQESVFEVRGFDGTREFRWHHTGAGQGRFVLLALTDTHDALQQDQQRELPAANSQWLLWGALTGDCAPDPHENTVSWHQLASARTGPYWVPVPAGVPMGQDDTRLRLAVTTVVTRDHHGNTSVMDEILTGFTCGKEAIE